MRRKLRKYCDVAGQTHYLAWADALTCDLCHSMSLELPYDQDSEDWPGQLGWVRNGRYGDVCPRCAERHGISDGPPPPTQLEMFRP